MTIGGVASRIRLIMPMTKLERIQNDRMKANGLHTQNRWAESNAALNRIIDELLPKPRKKNAKRKS